MNFRSWEPKVLNPGMISIGCCGVGSGLSRGTKMSCVLVPMADICHMQLSKISPKERLKSALFTLYTSPLIIFLRVRKALSGTVSLGPRQVYSQGLKSLAKLSSPKTWAQHDRNSVAQALISGPQLLIRGRHSAENGFAGCQGLHHSNFQMHRGTARLQGSAECAGPS